jgi:exopolysaccharide biosynthesis protein
VSANNVYIVVADGEGVMGGNGATASQAGNLFKNQLQATTAMNLDSGLSTEMVLNGVAGQRIINTITGEDSRINVNPYLATIQFPFVGAVANYIRAGQ